MSWTSVVWRSYHEWRYKAIPQTPFDQSPNSRILLLMLRKSGVHRLRLVVYPIIYKVLYIPGGDRRVSSINSSVSYRFQPSTSTIHIPHPTSQPPNIKAPMPFTLGRSWRTSSLSENNNGDLPSLKLGGWTNPFEKYTQVKLDHFPPSLHEFGYWNLAAIYFKLILLWNDCEEIIVCHHLSL